MYVSDGYAHRAYLGKRDEGYAHDHVSPWTFSFSNIVDTCEAISLSVCVSMYILICICASHLPSQPKKLDQLVSEFTVQALPNIDAFHTDLPTRYTNSGAPHLHELFSPLLNPHSA